MKKIIKKLYFIMSFCMFVSGILIANPTISSAKVKLNKKNLILFVKQTYKLKLKGTSNRVTWSSSKKNVATVSNKGLVKAKKIGKTTITAKVSNKKYTCKVNVMRNKPVDFTIPPETNAPVSQTPVSQTPTPPQVLQISKSEITLLKDENHTFNITFNTIPVDNTAAEWSSSDTTVASVNNGNVCGLKAGSSEITVKYNGIVATCKVNVEEPYIENSNITVKKNKTVNLSVKGTTKKVTWLIDNLKIINIDENGLVTGKKYGSAKAIASIGNYELVFNITVQDPAVDELLSKLVTTSTNLEKDIKELEKNESNLNTAKQALSKAQSTMIKVWDGRQWVYSTDKAAVTEAQNNVDYYTNIVEALKVKISDEEILIASYKRQLEILT